MKLKDLKTYIHWVNNKNKCVWDVVNIKDGPWVKYLETGDSELIHNTLKARQGRTEPNDYWYPIEDFNKLVESIKIHGFQNKFITDKKHQNAFNKNNWPGGKAPVQVSPNGLIRNGHHRCAILYYLYGPEYDIQIKNNILQNMPPK